MAIVPRITGTIDGPSGPRYTLLLGDVMDGLAKLKRHSVHSVVTSVPYYHLRDYGFDGQIGLEKSPEAYIAAMVKVFGKQGVWRVLRPDGVLWLNIGDTFTKDSKYGGTSGSKHEPHAAAGVIPRGYRSSSGLPNGNKLLIPFRLALALQADGWILRQDNIWAKPSPMPESIQGVRWTRCRVKVANATNFDAGKNGLSGDRRKVGFNARYDNPEDHSAKWAPCPGCRKCIDNGGFVMRQGSGRCTTSHEFMFQFVKSNAYFYDADSSKEPATCAASGRQSVKKGGFGGKGPAVAGREPFRAIVETRLLRSVWHISSEGTKVKHFAAYPTEMVRRPLSTTVSKGGCCADCGNQYAPIVLSDRVATRPGLDSKTASFQDRIGSRPRRPSQPNIIGNRDPQRHTTVTQVTGYRKTCSCATRAKSRPVVLDPFVGTGTTVQVALRMGCDAIGIDGSPEYIQIAEERAVTPWIPVGERKRKSKRGRVRKES